MPLSWNEIKERAVRFSKEFETAHNEEAEAQQFLIHFFNVFGISNRQVALFEYKVKRRDSSSGYIDLFWKGMIVVEMKSRGKSLDGAYDQAKEYIHGLPAHDIPKYIMVSDFENIRLHNLEDGSRREFLLKDFVSNVQYFDAIAGYQKHTYREEDPVNVRAAELMGQLHDRLKAVGYEGHPLELYLVRLLFCLFADDTGIFEKDIFHDFLLDKTKEDGSDLAMHLEKLFYVLNTPMDRRLKNLDESENAFPYVNGKLFEERLPPASFDRGMRDILLQCCYLNWSHISPAIFGSMFQSVMNPIERRNLGAHYTSEKNILKLIKPLFLDDLWEEFETVKGNSNKLKAFHRKIASLRFLDPACGCGNFLVITYREIRLIELAILRILHGSQMTTNITHLVSCDVDRFYGIEYEEFPAQIAQVAMWLMDHQMNMMVSAEFGEYLLRLPLIRSAKIIHGNALAIDWSDVIDPLSWEKPSDNSRFDYIFGNPPFIGKHLQNSEQKADMERVFGNFPGTGVLDYVTAWYLLAANYLRKFNTAETSKSDAVKVAFVSTNSITQGEQVGVLWDVLFRIFGVKIHFAHRTFAWGNDAKGNAAVHVVIIGFSNFDKTPKTLWFYDDIDGHTKSSIVQNINAYLIQGKDIVIKSRGLPIAPVPALVKGSQPTDGGHLLLSDEEKNELISKEPLAGKFIFPLLSARGFLHNEKRWCLWLIDATPNELKFCPFLMERIEAVRKFRLASKKAATVKWASYPGQFTENRQPKSDFILIPRHSSENRKYIPIGFFNANNIVGDSCSTITNAGLYHFGILTSAMHMAWVRAICGRLESRYRYSNDIVYNNYPWPINPAINVVRQIEELSSRVLAVRASFSDTSLADLYSPVLMPKELVACHQQLDMAVDKAYRSQPFPNEVKRLEFLFDLFEKYNATLFVEAKEKKKQKNKS